MTDEERKAIRNEQDRKRYRSNEQYRQGIIERNRAYRHSIAKPDCAPIVRCTHNGCLKATNTPCGNAQCPIPRSHAPEKLPSLIRQSIPLPQRFIIMQKYFVSFTIGAKNGTGIVPYNEPITVANVSSFIEEATTVLEAAGFSGITVLGWVSL